jgi:hypothetical protein
VRYIYNTKRRDGNNNLRNIVSPERCILHIHVPDAGRLLHVFIKRQFAIGINVRENRWVIPE